jgi:peptidoglycan L-alanyl-D-glutamate endopeptidase CwlK
MPSFGTESRKRLNTCHADLQEICELVIPNYDFTVLEGFRSSTRQDDLFRQGKSKLHGGQSKHNNDPSLAVDIAPYPIDWENPKRFYLLSGFMFQAASQLGIDLRWGGDWDGDWIHTDQSFHDLPHFELVEET